MSRSTPLPRPFRRALACVAVATLPLAACSGDSADATGRVGDTSTDTTDTGDAGDDEPAAGTTADRVGELGAVGTLVSAVVHELSFEFDEAGYDAMIETYSTTGDKDWIEATVTIDGITYEQVGIRLKGNSSLRTLAGDGPGGPGGGTTSADDPSSLPWLVKLDKYVDGQSHDGLTDLVVRSNTTATSLNEAVALELLEAAGLASQDAIAVSFAVNGGEPVLRLVIEHPDDTWMAEWFDDDGALYKAESTGDYSYRGDDPSAYDEVFDQEAGEENADLTPLVDFLRFVNESDDVTFADQLDEWLDVDAFATYLAVQDLIDNFDDIDGPGNNSYLYYATESGVFTVVPWDHNLAFGQGPGGGGFPDGAAPGTGGDGRPDLGDRPTPPGGATADGALSVGGPRAGSNVLVERFLAVDAWQAEYDSELARLRVELFDSGVATDVLAEWVEVIESSGLVDAATIASEASNIESQLA